MLWFKHVDQCSSSWREKTNELLLLAPLLDKTPINTSYTDVSLPLADWQWKYVFHRMFPNLQHENNKQPGWHKDSLTASVHWLKIMLTHLH